jgi:tRNA threonylcarbamoyladenosine biosynthesis protein TsaB
LRRFPGSAKLRRSMPSLNQLLAAHAPLLVLDAAAARIQVGSLAADGGGRWETSEEEAGVGIFQCVERLRVDLDAVGAFVFCAGPGSILGIRTVAMALRAWGVARLRPGFAYGSLDLVAQSLRQPEVGIIADARRDLWHVAQWGQELRRVPTDALPTSLLMPEGFRHWSPLASSRFARTPYLLAEMLAQPQVRAAELFRPTDAPDAFLHEEPSYAAWVPRVHGA